MSRAETPGSSPPLPPPDGHPPYDPCDAARAVAGRFSIPGLSAEDVAQEAALAAVEALRRFAEISAEQLPGYVHTHVRHHLCRLLERHAREAGRVGPLGEDAGRTVEDHHPGPAEQVERDDLGVWMQDELTGREFVVLTWTAARYSTAEIAAHLGCAQATVRSLRRHAVAKLRRAAGE